MQTNYIFTIKCVRCIQKTAFYMLQRKSKERRKKEFLYWIIIITDDANYAICFGSFDLIIFHKSFYIYILHDCQMCKIVWSGDNRSSTQWNIFYNNKKFMYLKFADKRPLNSFYKHITMQRIFLKRLFLFIFVQLVVCCNCQSMSSGFITTYHFVTSTKYTWNNAIYIKLFISINSIS